MPLLPSPPPRAARVSAQAVKMAKVEIHEAKTHFSRLVARAEAGEEIVVRRGPKPVAKLVAYS